MKATVTRSVCSFHCRDDSGVVTRMKEVVSSTEEAGVVHVLFGEDGKPSMAYSEDMEEVRSTK